MILEGRSLRQLVIIGTVFLVGIRFHQHGSPRIVLVQVPFPVEIFPDVLLDFHLFEGLFRHGFDLFQVVTLDVLLLGLLQQGILLKLLIDGLQKFEARELKQSDRLLQLGSHDQLLGLLQLLSEFERRHESVPLR